MSYVYYLAGDDLNLAEADLKGFLRSQDISEEPEIKDKIAITSSEPQQLRRLVLTHEVGELVFRGDIEEFDADLPSGSFKVRAKIIEKSEQGKKTIEEELGEKIESESREVDLDNPDHVFKAYVFSDEIIVARLVLDVERSLFEKRSNENRPYSSPVSLDPVLARVMVNLSEVSPGEYILDPFCGTGGILIEAGLCGIGVKGSDISQEMVDGSEKNLEKYGVINHDIRQLEVKEALDSFDNYKAIVTDLPYGKASETEGDIEEKFRDILDSKDGRTVFCYNKPELGRYESDFEVYVHKNLTRYIFVI